MKKSKIVLTIIITMILTSFSAKLFAQELEYTYAYVTITGKAFSKKLNVNVDFGDTPEQIAEGEKYSEILTNKKSFAAILNYMVENKFEFVQALDYVSTYQGSGGTSGVVFILRKKK
jgi:hypothetical protein